MYACLWMDISHVVATSAPPPPSSPLPHTHTHTHPPNSPTHANPHPLPPPLTPLAKLPGGIGRFLPCGVGSHTSRLRHLGWNRCSHGLTSRPVESCHHRCLNTVCGVLGYPKDLASELLDGTLKLRYCTSIFTACFPRGLYQGLVMGVVKGLLLLLVISWMMAVTWLRGSG